MRYIQTEEADLYALKGENVDSPTDLSHTMVCQWSFCPLCQFA